MLKKTIYFTFLLVFTLSFTFFSIPSNSTFAKDNTSSNNDALSPDTVITKDNVYKVLDYFGIEHNNLTLYKENAQLPSVTVQEFAEQLNQTKSQPREATLKDPISISPFQMTGGGGGGSNGGKGTATISKKVWTSRGYSLTFTQTGHYNKGKWTSAGGSSAQVSSNTDIDTGGYEITSAKFNAGVKSSGTILWQDSTIKINEYINVGIGHISVGSCTNYYTATWGTNYIP